MNVTLVNSDFPSATAVPPLGILSLAQVIERAGHSVQLRDYQLARPLKSRDPRTFASFCDTTDEVLGVSVSGFSLPLVIAGLKELKQKNSSLTVILGGIGASGAAEQIIEAFPFIDMIVYGEGEETIIELLDCIQVHQEPVNVPGVIYRYQGQARVNRKRPRIQDLRKLGTLDFRLIDLTRYQLINVISSRGCPFPCTFCDVAPYWERKYVPRPLDLLIKDITNIARLVHPIPTFIFVDDTLTVDNKRMTELCYQINATGLNIQWACYARANDLNKELLALMAESGCRKVYLGLESGSDRILKAVDKGFSVETGRNAAILARQFIPIVQTSFVWGFPFETWEDFYETLMLMAYLTSKGVSVKANLLTPLPFSTLFQEFAGSLAFDPEYSSQLHVAEYELESEMVELIRKYPRIFPCFYLYDNPSVREKYNLLKEMKLSPEDIWDIWLTVKGTVPLRERMHVPKAP